MIKRIRNKLRRYTISDNLHFPSKIQLAINALDDKRAVDIKALDLRQVSSSLSYFIIATGESNLQLKAMQESVREQLKAGGEQIIGVEGPAERWVLMDYGEMVIHIMSDEAREFYDLEGLWADAVEINVEAA